MAATCVRREMAGRYARAWAPAPALWPPHLAGLRGVLVEVVPSSESGAGREGGWLWFTVARLLCAQVRQRARGAAGGAYDWLVHVIFREKYRPDWIASGAGDVEVRDVGEGADTSMPGCGR